MRWLSLKLAYCGTAFFATASYSCILRLIAEEIEHPNTVFGIDKVVKSDESETGWVLTTYR